MGQTTPIADADSTTEKAGLALHHRGAVDQPQLVEHLVGEYPVQVAIHYANVPSFDRDDDAYGTSGRTALKYLTRFAQNSTPICAHYSHLNGEAYVGTLTDEFSVLVTRDGEILDEVDAAAGERVQTAYDDADAVSFLKTAALENPIKITEEEYPILFEPSRWNAGKAFHPWDTMRDLLVRILAGDAGGLTAKTLPWPLAEKLVEEYMRRSLVPDFAKQADGRGGRETIDLLGFDAEGRHVVAQTTTATTTDCVQEKAQNLHAYIETRDARYGYLFALEETKPEWIGQISDLEFVPLEHVLSYCRDKPGVHSLIE